MYGNNFGNCFNKPTNRQNKSAYLYLNKSCYCRKTDRKEDFFYDIFQHIESLTQKKTNEQKDCAIKTLLS